MRVSNAAISLRFERYRPELCGVRTMSARFLLQTRTGALRPGSLGLVPGGRPSRRRQAAGSAARV